MTGQRLCGPAVRLDDIHCIYALYDRADRLVDVGRSGKGKRPGIRTRVYAHRVEDRWNFDSHSRFDVLSVDDAVMYDAEMMSIEQLIKDLEALLVYLLEPSWNKNGGTYGKLPRYRQVPVSQQSVEILYRVGLRVKF